MAKNYYYSITVIISLFIIASCAPESTFTGNDVVYQLNVTVDPPDAGAVTPGSAELIEGDEVEISASPNNGWVFDGWQGDHTGTANPVTITMDRDKDILALFIKREYPLTVTIEGEGSVSERVIQDASSPYQTVELTANPSEGWRFVEWKGDLTGSDNPTQIEVTEEKEVTAIFVRKTYQISVSVEGEGTVSEEVVEEGKVVKLTATAASGWVFDRWEGDLTGSENPSQVEITTEKVITAIFKKGHFALNIEVNGNGSVEKALQSGNESGGLYELGSEVRLTASADTGWQFGHWSEGASGDANPVTITIGVNNNVTAAFVRQVFTLSADTEGEGSVSETLVSGTSAQAGYLYESVVELAATPASGWQFSHWTGDVTGGENPTQITMDSNKTVTAVFVKESAKESFTLTVDTKRKGSVSRSLQSGSEADGQYASGSVVRLTATTDKDWEFLYWEGDLSGGQNPQTIIIDTDKSVTAVFMKKK